MKPITKIRFRSVAVGLLLSALAPAKAAATSYSATLAGNRNWDTAEWTPAGTPGAGDVISDLSASANFNFYLNGDRSVDSLSRITAGGTVRVLNGTSGTSAGNSLAIDGELAVQAGSISFRGTAPGLTVTMHDLVLGRTGGVGNVTIGETEELQYVTFSVLGTTTLTGGLSNLQIGATSVANASTFVDLGHVVFKNIEATAGTVGLAVTPAGVELKVKSLRTEGTVYTSASVRGSGILTLTGTANDPLQPEGRNRFESNITGDLEIRKTGDNAQIFARARGNNYAGGTKIGAGILAVSNGRNNESGLGTGAVEVSDGGTLAASGFGTVRLGADKGVSVKSGGIVAPGALGEDGFVELRLNGSANGNAAILSMESGAAFTFRLGEGNQSDLVTFLGYSGAADLLLNQTAVNVTGEIQEGVYMLFAFKSNESSAADTSGLTGVSSGLTGGLTLGSGFGGFTGVFYYDDPLHGGAGTISLEIAAIPEPATGMMIGVAVAGFALAFRGRAQRAAKG